MIFALNDTWAFPFRFAGFLVPCFQLLFTVWMPFPKFTKYFPGNYPQLLIIAKDNKSSHNGRFNFELPDYQRSWCMTPNEQVLLQGCNSLLVRPEPLLIKNIKVQDNK
jgi:hypothetical protein